MSLDGFSFDTTIGLGPTDAHIWRNDELAALQAQQRYLLQLGCVDSLVGELVDHLKTIGMYDETLIVLTSDHGVSFIPGASRRRIANANPQDILPTLLMIKAPYQHSGIISDRNVESIDIVPTVADILGITIPWPLDGQSAMDKTTPARLRKDVLHGGYRLGFDGNFNQRFKSVERTLEHFGSGTDPHGLFRIGPYSHCVGKQLEEFEVNNNALLTVHIENNDSFFPNLNRPNTLVPCLFRGTIEATKDVKRPVSLAFAVNGVIRAVTRTYLLEGLENTWTVMLPEDALQKNECRLEAYVIHSSKKTIHLEHVPLKSKTKIISTPDSRE